MQICWEDAVAYAKWVGKRLPTKAECEFAARGGRYGSRYFRGDEFGPDRKCLVNAWTGGFPYRNTQEEGFVGTAPVKSHPPNGYGLYDMAGNVWNWCSDWYRPDTHAWMAKTRVVCANPTGPLKSFSPVNPYQTERVTKGGSFLCSESYCASYPPSARRGLPPDIGMSHVGFSLRERSLAASAHRNHLSKVSLERLKTPRRSTASLSLMFRHHSLYARHACY